MLNPIDKPSSMKPGPGATNPIPLILGCLLSRAAGAGAAVDEEATWSGACREVHDYLVQGEVFWVYSPP